MLKGGVAEEQNAAPGNTNKRPKLVLHFDIRNTMIVADTVTSITVEQALNAYLTGVLWGREVGENQWEWSSHEPTLLPPAKVNIKSQQYEIISKFSEFKSDK